MWQTVQECMCMSASRKSLGIWDWAGCLGADRDFCDRGVSLWASPKATSLSTGGVCEIPAQAVSGYTRKSGLPAAGGWGAGWGVGRHPVKKDQPPPAPSPLTTDFSNKTPPCYPLAELLRVGQAAGLCGITPVLEGGPGGRFERQSEETVHHHELLLQESEWCVERSFPTCYGSRN